MTQRLATRNRKLHQALGKFHNRKTEIDGIVFASALEARVYQRLKLIQKSGAISGLRLQVPFVLVDGFTDSNGKRWLPTKYLADFVYEEKGVTVAVDSKSAGTMTRVFAIKRKLFLSRYPKIRFEVVTE